MPTLSTTFSTISRASRPGQYSLIGPVANVGASDNSYCTFPTTQGGDPAILSGGSGYSQWLTVRDLASKVPTGSTIVGITLKMEVRRGSNLVAGRDSSLRVVKAGSQVGSDKANTTTQYPTTDTVITRGGSADLWGTTWTDSEVNASGFGFDISVYYDDSNDFAEYVYIDQVTVDIEYTSGGSTNWTGSGDAVVSTTASASGTVTLGPGTYTRTFRLQNWSVVARTGSTFGWTNEANAALSDDARAQTTGMQGNNGSGGYTTYLVGQQLTNNDAIPNGATINGIKVNIERRTDPSFMTGVRDSVVSLVRAGTIESTNKAATSTNYPVTTDAVASYGGTADLWSASWAPSDVNASGFGVALSVANFTSTGVPVAGRGEIDQITVEVTFTIPAGGTNWTGAGDAVVSVVAQSASQHNMRIGASATVTLNAQMKVGTLYQSLVSTVASASGFVQKFGASDVIVSAVASGGSRLTFTGQGGASVSATATCDGFRTARPSAAGTVSTTAQASSPVQGSGTALCALTVQCDGLALKYAGAVVLVSVLASATGVQSKTGQGASIVSVVGQATGTRVLTSAATAILSVLTQATPGGVVGAGAATSTVIAQASAIVRAGVGGSAVVSAVSSATLQSNLTGAGTAASSVVAQASGVVQNFIGANAVLTVVARASASNPQQTQAFANVVALASANGTVIEQVGGSASIPFIATADGIVPKTQSGSASLSTTASASGLVTRLGASDVVVSLVASTAPSQRLLAAGSAQLSIVASTIFPALNALARAVLTTTAQATGRVTHRPTLLAFVRVSANVNPFKPYYELEPVRFEINEPVGRVRFKV